MFIRLDGIELALKSSLLSTHYNLTPNLEAPAAGLIEPLISIQLESQDIYNQSLPPILSVLSY